MESSISQFCSQTWHLPFSKVCQAYGSMRSRASSLDAEQYDQPGNGHVQQDANRTNTHIAHHSTGYRDPSLSLFLSLFTFYFRISLDFGYCCASSNIETARCWSITLQKLAHPRMVGPQPDHGLSEAWLDPNIPTAGPSILYLLISTSCCTSPATFVAQLSSARAK